MEIKKAFSLEGLKSLDRLCIISDCLVIGSTFVVLLNLSRSGQILVAISFAALVVSSALYVISRLRMVVMNDRIASGVESVQLSDDGDNPDHHESRALVRRS